MKILRHGMLHANESNIHISGYKFDAEGQLTEGNDLVKTVLEYLSKALENKWIDLEFTSNEVENAQSES